MFESDDDEEEWNKPVEASMCESPNSRSCFELKNSDSVLAKDGQDHSRVILHIDIDCFYAQVEMIRNPSLRNKPLGIQQKYIVVTCNYPARERGVTKLMRIVDAKEKCPELMLVSGEDLTNYREMSYKISNYLQKYCPLVERLGFDENFLDVTELVKDRLDSTNCDKEIKGYVYNEAEIQDCCGCGCHDRLRVGSQVAADIREGLYDELGITSCGGVAVNKLLSKLVAGKHKPNCQTTLFPEQIRSLLGELTSTRQIPGIGSTTSRRLKDMGISTVQELQHATKISLEEEFGAQAAENMKNWCYGNDKSPIVAFGLPQTLSDEDSFAARKVSNIAGVKTKLNELIGSLLQRVLTDGRTPRTFRLTVRKMSSDNRYLNRESRQCSLPSSLFNKFSKDNLRLVCTQLETHAYDLFTKMVDIKQPFYLTLINVAFTKLEQVTGKNSITSFFSPKKSETQTSPGKEDTRDHKTVTDKGKEHIDSNRYCDNKPSTSPVSFDKFGSNIPVNHFENTKRKNGLLNWFNKSADINDNIYSSEKGALQANDDDKFIVQSKRKAGSSLENMSRKIPKHNDNQNSMISKTHEEDRNIGNLPENIDENVFKQLPLDIQKEIISQHRTVQHNSKTRDFCAINYTKSDNSDHLVTTVDSKSKSTFFFGRKRKGLNNNSLTSSETLIPTDIVKGQPKCPTTYFPATDDMSSSDCFKDLSVTGNCSDQDNSSQTSCNDRDNSSQTSCNDGDNSSQTSCNDRDNSSQTSCNDGDNSSQTSCNDRDNSSQTSCSNQQRLNLPHGIDRDVFDALPTEIQNEVLKDMKCGAKSQSLIKDSSVISVKSPKASSNVNIMSFFPKTNKKKLINN